MAVAIAWLPGPAGTRRRVAKPSVEEPDAAEPARPDLWGARVRNDPGLPDLGEVRGGEAADLCYTDRSIPANTSSAGTRRKVGPHACLNVSILKIWSPGQACSGTSDRPERADSGAPEVPRSSRSDTGRCRSRSPPPPRDAGPPGASPPTAQLARSTGAVAPGAGWSVRTPSADRRPLPRHPS